MSEFYIPQEGSRILGEMQFEPYVIPHGSELEQFIADLEDQAVEYQLFGSGKNVGVAVDNGLAYKFFNGAFVLATAR